MVPENALDAARMNVQFEFFLETHCQILRLERRFILQKFFEVGDDLDSQLVRCFGTPFDWQQSL